MAGVVDICNVALSLLGDSATVASIDPPEGSVQAEHCARFYPLARDALLVAHPWTWALRRASLAVLSSAWPQWEYAYARPSDALRILDIQPPGLASDDPGSALIRQVYPQTYPATYYAEPLGYMAGPVSFACELDAAGNQVIYTDQQGAVCRYIARVADPVSYSPLFQMALSHHLASMIAGPILKGDAGAAMAKSCAGVAQAYLSQAITADANQGRADRSHSVPWLAARS